MSAAQPVQATAPRYRPGQTYVGLAFTAGAALVALLPGRGFDWTPVVLWSLLVAVLVTVPHVVFRGYRTFGGRALWLLPQVALQTAYLEIFTARLMGLSFAQTAILFSLIPVVALVTLLIGGLISVRHMRLPTWLAISPAIGAGLGFAIARGFARVLPITVIVAVLVGLALGWTALWVWFLQRTYLASRAAQQPRTGPAPQTAGDR